MSHRHKGMNSLYWDFLSIHTPNICFIVAPWLICAVVAFVVVFSKTNSSSDEKEVSSKRLLLVKLGGQSRLPVLRRFCEMNCKITCINHVQPPWADSLGITWVISEPSIDEISWNNLIQLLSNRNKISEEFDAVLSYDEFGLLTAAKLAEMKGLPHIPFNILSLFRNKGLFRQFCIDEKLPAPRFWVFQMQAQDNPESFAETATLSIQMTKGLRFPLVFKPCLGAGSKFVHKCSSIDDVRNAVKRYVEIDHIQLCKDSAGGVEGRPSFLFEEFCIGREVDVDCVVQNGELLFASISDNKPSSARILPQHSSIPDKQSDFRERGGSCPSILSSFEQKNIIRTVRHIVSRFGKNLFGVFHWEFIVAKDGTAIPIDLNMRIGGAETYVMIQTVWGVDLAEVSLNLALGKTYSAQDFPQVPLRAAASVNYVPDGRIGCVKLTHIDGVCQQLQQRNFVWQELYFQPGDIVRCPPGNFDYLGWCVASGRNVEEAEENVQEIASLISFTFD